MLNALKITLAVAAPVILAVVLYLVYRFPKFKQLDYKHKQIIYGVSFGILAILSTENGIPVAGAQLNCRDAAVLIAGLFFGSPAGIIAGLIGGIERWIAVAWGIGSYTRVACSLSTIIAGFYAAALRKYMFDEKKPSAFISFAIGVVMEVLHMTMVFITNMDDAEHALAVVRACTIPLVFANAFSVMLASLALTLLSGRKLYVNKYNARISQIIQRWLLLTIVFAFLSTSIFVYRLQDGIADNQTDQLLELAIDEISSEIMDASDENLLKVSKTVASAAQNGNLDSIASKNGVAEINVVDQNGIIVKSTVEEFIGYDMASDEQSAAFLCLLTDETEYVQEYGSIALNPSVKMKYAGVRIDSGFVQIGYDSEQFQRDIDSRVIGCTKYRHVGSTGFLLILDEKYRVVSAPSDFALVELSREITESGTDLNLGSTFTMTVDDVTYFCRCGATEGYYILSMLPEDEALQERNVVLYMNTFMEILVFAVLFGLIYLLIKAVVVDQIKNINKSLARIAGGDLNEVVDVRSNEEFASLSNDINSTVDTLKHYISEASARIDKELEFAKNIQTSALPNVFPAFPKRSDLDIYASMDPAKEVGGDFYDFYITNNDTLNFLVADVSGKGIPAAMFMMRAKTELKTLTEADMKINNVFTHGNAALCEGNSAGMFVTAWQGSIDLNTGLLRYANAGHNPPLIKRGNGKFEYLKSRAGFVLAGMDGVNYKAQEMQLEPGDIVYLYTDGVTEATDSNETLYGEERLLNAINSQEFKDMKELCRYIRADVDNFVGQAPQFDDITMVAFKYIGTPPAPSIHFDNAQLDDITAVTEFAEAELEKMGCSMKTVTQVNIAIDEIFSNIVRYGYPGSSGSVTVELIESKDPHRVCIRFTDNGIPYNPLIKDDPDTTLSAEDRNIGGLGIYMVKKTMDDMQYEYKGEMNILSLYKRLD